MLIGEDEALLAIDLGRQLRELGCEVAGVAARIEALRPYLGPSCCGLDLALLDVNLDGRLSYAAAEQLLAQGVPVIFITGYGDLPSDRWIGDDRVVLLRKPVVLRKLANAIADLFAARRVGDTNQPGLDR